MKHLAISFCVIFTLVAAMLGGGYLYLDHKYPIIETPASSFADVIVTKSEEALVTVEETLAPEPELEPEPVIVDDIREIKMATVLFDQWQDLGMVARIRIDNDDGAEVEVHVFHEEGRLKVWGFHSGIESVDQITFQFKPQGNKVVLSTATETFDNTIKYMLRNSSAKVSFSGGGLYSRSYDITLIGFTVATEELRQSAK